MATPPPFFSIQGMKEPINQWLGIALIGLMCTWTLIYYLGHKAEALAETFVPVEIRMDTNRVSHQ